MNKKTVLFLYILFEKSPRHPTELYKYVLHTHNIMIKNTGDLHYKKLHFHHLFIHHVCIIYSLSKRNISIHLVIKDSFYIYIQYLCMSPKGMKI